MYSNTENSIFSIETMFVVILFFYSSLQLSQTFVTTFQQAQTLRLITSKNASLRRVDNTCTYCVQRPLCCSFFNLQRIKTIQRLNEGGLNRASRFLRYDSFKEVLALHFLRITSGSIKLATPAKSSRSFIVYQRYRCN